MHNGITFVDPSFIVSNLPKRNKAVFIGGTCCELRKWISSSPVPPNLFFIFI